MDNVLNQQSKMLTPLGAGDLIDRAVRLYRRFFLTLIRVAALPVVVSAIGSVLITLGWRGFYTTGAEVSFALYFVLVASGLLLTFLGYLMMLMAMGGAARNLVRHLLWGEPVSVVETYRSVRERFWSLLAATLIFVLIVGTIGVVFSYLWSMLLLLALVLSFALGYYIPLLGVLVGIVTTLGVTLVTLWLFFLLAGKFAYMPQILLVEGQGVFSSLGRSVTLASGNWFKLASLVLFSVFATYSALMILWLPLVLYASSQGIPVLDFESSEIPPVWYSISLQVIGQASFILLAPIWMLGLSLMYVDERVKQEAYDVELMAARSLGEMPALANPEHNPLRPALGKQSQMNIPPPDFSQTSNITTLGLR
jgi:hypothetical protein